MSSNADSKHLLLTRGSSTASIGIAGSQANDPLWISRSGGGDLFITSAGNVGIGTSTPPTKLANTSTRIANADGLTVHTSGLNWALDAQGYVAALSNLATSDNHIGGLLVEIGGTGGTNKILDLESGGVNRVRVLGNGNTTFAGDVTVNGDLVNAQDETIRRTNFSAKPYLVGNNATQTDLIAAQASPFSTAWSSAYMTSNAQESAVSSGTAWASRNADAQAILTLMGAPNAQHFLGNFNIRRVTAARPAGTSGYTLPYQQVQMPGPGATVTHAAFVKHISGPVPTGWWCNGLTSGGGWQWCKTYTVSGTAAGYNHTHPYTTNTNPSTPTVILVALAGSVPQYIATSAEWALFMMGPR